MPEAKKDLAFRKCLVKSPDFRTTLIGDGYSRLELAIHVFGQLLEPLRNDSTDAPYSKQEGNWNTIIVVILDDNGKQLR